MNRRGWIVCVVLCMWKSDFVSGDCMVNNGGCQHRCTDVVSGTVQCQCEPGFMLHRDRQTCDDIEECLVDNGGCEGVCVNKPGSHECSCKIGSLQMDGTSCKVSTLSCHECDTYQEDSGCGDPMEGEDNVADCDQATHCLKLKTQVTKVDTMLEPGLKKRVVISRQCARAPHATNGCKATVGGGSRHIRCYCDTDNCNASSKPRPSTLPLVCLLSAVFVFVRF